MNPPELLEVIVEGELTPDMIARAHRIIAQTLRERHPDWYGLERNDAKAEEPLAKVVADPVAA